MADPVDTIYKSSTAVFRIIKLCTVFPNQLAKFLTSLLTNPRINHSLGFSPGSDTVGKF